MTRAERRFRLAVAGAVLVVGAAVAVATAAGGPAAPPPRRDVVTVPCRLVPVPGGGTECEYRVDASALDGARLVILDPAPGPEASRVRAQIDDARQGVAP